MSRHYIPISIDELKRKIQSILIDDEYNIRDLTAQIRKDFKKVDVDTENTETEGFDEDKEIIGYHIIGDFAYFGFSCGGDWECPVFHIIYWDGKKLRGYIPEDGNPWNKKTKQAYGNDYKNPEDKAHMEDGFEKDKIIKDITTRIQKK